MLKLAQNRSFKLALLLTKFPKFFNFLLHENNDTFEITEEKRVQSYDT